MDWKNNATPRSLRLGTHDGELYYEIGLHAQFDKLVIACENISEGKRIYSKSVTTDELLKEFPSLKDFETLLRAYERIAGFMRIELNRDVERAEAKGEYDKLPEGFRKQFLEGYIKGLEFDGGTNDN